MAELHTEAFFRSQYHVEVLSSQGGAKVLLCDNEVVFKTGTRVRRAEEVALRLVIQHTNVPVPEVASSYYDAHEGHLCMLYIPGKPLSTLWDQFDRVIKERLCNEI
jgi:hypothetical protein